MCLCIKIHNNCNSLINNSFARRRPKKNLLAQDLQPPMQNKSNQKKMKRFLLSVIVSAFAFGAVSCSQQAKWNHQQKQALRDALRSYRQMVYLQDLTDPEFVIFTDGVAADIELAYPVYATFMQLPAVDDTVDMFVVTAIVEQLNEDASNMRHLFPYRELVKNGILPDKLTHQQQHAFYRCLAQKVNGYYESVDEFLSDIIQTDNAAQTQINTFMGQCATDLFDWVIEITEVDVEEPAGNAQQSCPNTSNTPSAKSK